MTAETPHGPTSPRAIACFISLPSPCQSLLSSPLTFLSLGHSRLLPVSGLLRTCSFFCFKCCYDTTSPCCLHLTLRFDEMIAITQRVSLSTPSPPHYTVSFYFYLCSYMSRKLLHLFICSSTYYLFPHIRQ